jgi:hypothetical protein
VTTLDTPTLPIVLADSIRELSAEAHLRFNQAWLRQTGLATSGHEIQSHLQRHALFVQQGDLNAIGISLNNLVESFNAQEAGEPFLAAVLAPCVRSIGSITYADLTPAGLEKTANDVLATGIGQAALEETVELLKKNFSPS